MRHQAKLEGLGFAFHRGLLGAAEAAELAASLEAIPPERMAAWHLLSHLAPQVQATVSRAVRGLVAPILGADALLLHATCLEKGEAANWSLAWHQDLRVAAQRVVRMPGYGPSSVEAGIPHVRPTTDILEQMLIVRIHVDECSEADGALRVVPGSHRAGRMAEEEIGDYARRRSWTICAAQPGDALLMRPLLVHDSPRATGRGRRRILHLELAPCAMLFPPGWFDPLLDW